MLKAVVEDEAAEAVADEEEVAEADLEVEEVEEGAVEADPEEVPMVDSVRVVLGAEAAANHQAAAMVVSLLVDSAVVALGSQEASALDQSRVAPVTEVRLLE